MNKIFFIILFTISSGLMAQKSDEAQILSDSQEFQNYLLDGNYDGILDFTYPVVFEEVDRETLKKMFKSAFEGNENYLYEVLDIENRKYQISNIFKDETTGNIKYAFITYPFSMKLQINDPKLTKQLKDEMLFRLSKDGMLIEVINEDTYILTTLGMTIAFNDKSTNGDWKYLNYSKNNRFFLKFVPERIVNEANNYYSEKNKE